MMRSYIPDELFQELEQIEHENIQKIQRKEAREIKILKHQLRGANKAISKMRLDFMKEVTELRNKLALSYGQPRRIVKLEDQKKRNEMGGNQAQLMQRMLLAQPATPELVAASFFDELEVANKDVRTLLNYKLQEM